MVNAIIRKGSVSTSDIEILLQSQSEDTNNKDELPIDEKIVSDSIYNWVRQPESKPDAIIYVADVNNIRRNLYFCTQLLELDIPTILLLNMNDILIEENKFDHIKLKEELNVLNVIPFSAVTHEGLNTLKDTLTDLFENPIESINSKMSISKNILNLKKTIQFVLTKKSFPFKKILSSIISLPLSYILKKKINSWEDKFSDNKAEAQVFPKRVPGAMPLPPRKRRKTGQMCPTITRTAATASAIGEPDTNLAKTTAAIPLARSPRSTKTAALPPTVRNTLVIPILPLP